MERRYCKAIIEWINGKDPNKFPLNEWLHDIVVIFGEVVGKIIHGDAWTVLVRVTEVIDESHTYADVAFIVEEAPWHLLEPGYSFKLWAGRDIAAVTIL
ncbi:hypothetical protein [Cohnella sp. JJ-181]|uniref:hypothetical protein n=1 Tax=Cohnella rhizoplanae TaxID=2974897 RepID=UPI0022FFB29B|nr:hypothetical protein [Cohnella sp. JJ-181]CAI6079523.1 hypothetical protein COHCIP112018_02783 [Cohnella sp. JJ-181]